MSEEIVIKNQETRKLRVSIKTFGCQMNQYDTEVASGLLQDAGYEILPEGDSGASADIILMNTCSVREHAEDRVYSRLGILAETKKQNPDLVLGLLGCMVEEHREKLFRRFPQLDLMIGTRNLVELPALIGRVRKERRQIARIKQDGISIEYTELIKRRTEHHAWLPIMTGCNKVCTFCIVPITRGSEVSMPARDVYREAARLAGEGVRWITLLGQNVNSYNGAPAGELSSNVSFPKLLDTLCEIEGLFQISFTTSHPHDATPKLFEVIARNPKISRRFHLPLQSGSDAVLKRMKRLHTYEEYAGKIERMRGMIPDVLVTTDIIAGFSGETEESHRETMKALEDLRFDGAYIYKYSVRAGTPAAKLPDDVPLEVKERRNQELLETQKRISDENYRARLGRTVIVFAESVNARNPDELVGRTNFDKKVIFRGSRDQIGAIHRVELTELIHETFKGVALGPSR
ncbi:MAG: tRNA (N6-isopentenyl adenosine(37)-C2)-methylthiotransferase MiaB [Candidatus Omnitrophota bacterium]|nr:tRNA (N6-isopentenyl adenosine(37)-C2)-methylthiotransferase MiaB [Candidatus Omnitrophota bacterium]